MDEIRPPVGFQKERGILALLRRMREVVADAANAQARLDQLTRLIAAHIVADVCSIYLRRLDDDLELYSTEGLKKEAVHQTRLKWGQGLVGIVAATQAPLVTAEAPLHPSFVYKPETGEDPLHSFLGVPLIRSGKVLGVLVLQNKASRRYSDEEVEAAQAVALLLAEIAASGELLGNEDTAAVDVVLHRPDRIDAIGVVPGFAFGRASFHDAPRAHHKIFATDKAAEVQRLEDGLAKLRKSVDNLLADEALAGVSRELLETYRLFAYDRGWKERLRNVVFSGLTAEAAVERVKAENRARLSQARDPYLRERLHDLDDLAHRLLRHLSGDAEDNPRTLTQPSIIVARAMGPADLLEYDRGVVRGLVLVEGSATSHVAIVARALSIPVVSGVEGALERIFEKDFLVIDGAAGEVHIRPTPEVIEAYKVKGELQSERQALFARERELPSVTRDGRRIDILMNAGLALDMPHLHDTGAAGIGLFRTELQFLIGRQLPGVAAQEKLYREVLDAARGKPVVFRTADLGGDKSAAYMKHARESNPAMGWRGLRLAIDRPGLLRPQLRALLAAASGRPLDLMLPMVTFASEVDAARAMLDKEIANRTRRGLALPSAIRLGAMIETPAAAWRAGEIAARVDFLSIGGNDLAQFYFAADRDAEWADSRFDPVEPGFLSFIGAAVARVAPTGRPLAYCGEQAADPVMAAALMGVGVTRFSAPATTVGWFRRLVRSLDVDALERWLADNLSGSRDAFRARLKAFLGDHGVELPDAA